MKARSSLYLWRHTLQWLGQFHVLVIHFPIALLLAAAVGEALCVWRNDRKTSPSVRFCVLLGTGGAVVAMILGWLHADFGGYGSDSPDVLTMHRWIGTCAALCSVAIALVCEFDHRRQRRSLLFRLILGFGAVLVAAAAHLGGTLVHGNDFLVW